MYKRINMEITAKNLLLYAKIDKIKQEIPELPKTKKGYNYMYTGLDDMMKILDPLLVKYKLSKVHSTYVNGGSNIMKTMIIDLDNGVSIESTLILDSDIQLAKMNKVQSLGSQLTYYRRYHTALMFDLISEEDNDGSSKNSKNPTLKNNEPDFKTIFTNLIKANKPSAVIERHFNNQKDKMSPETLDLIKKLIKEKYTDLPF